MQKATLAEAGILTAFAVIAARLATELADHNVSTLTIIPIILFAITTGGSIAISVGQTMRTTLYTCPTKGCPVTIRARDTSPDELQRLKSYANDHSKHGSNR